MIVLPYELSLLLLHQVVEDEVVEVVLQSVQLLNSYVHEEREYLLLDNTVSEEIYD